MGFAAVAQIAAMAISAGAAIHQGETQKNYNNYLAAQAEADAKAEKGAAEVEAGRIRKAAKQQRAEAIAALASSGVDVNSGTALKIDQRIARDSEEDAVMALTGGSDRALRLQAEAGGNRQAAGRAQAAGYVGATSSLLQGGLTMSNGWKKAGGT